jgi:pimeloyl-ACP methyl ester carboxylesterase
MQTHLSPRHLPGTRRPDKDVQALFSAQPDGRAVLFIHGYSGDALDTWSDFHVLLPGGTACRGRDLFFYGYDGLRAEMTASAALFRDFLARLFGRPAALVNESLPPEMQRQQGFEYHDVVIVAHSLGAVIARRALLDATRVGTPWVQNVRMVLYAPAHKGATVAELALEAAGSFRFLRLFSSLARFQSPLIDQLKAGSPDLLKLLEDTEEACRNGANPHLIARRVVIAEYERIVRNETFASDPPPETIPDTTHISVCKPSSSATEALRHLEDCL